MKRIPRTQGKFALVDDCDYEFLIGLGTWYFHQGYATRNSRRKPSKTIRMHRVIAERAGLDVSRQIDHADQDKLNKSSLQLATGNQPAEQTEQRSTAK